MAVFNHTGHKELWDWLSKNPHKRKSQWPRWKQNGGIYPYCKSGCFACEYDDDKAWENGDDSRCFYCPLEEQGNEFRCSRGPYALWEQSQEEKDIKRIIYYAIKMRDLPVKAGVETI